jgi:hypothetical protein
MEEWNGQLGEVAREWSGIAYLFDTNASMLDRIRDWQLYAAGIEEENGLGTWMDGRMSWSLVLRVGSRS